MELILSGAHTGQRAWAYTGGRALDARRPAIVFVHGALHDHSVWTLLARRWAHHGHTVLAVDQPGHARSAGQPLASVEAIADWLLAVLDAAGVQRAALIGHSMGSLIALEAAARAPERASHLVMLGTACPMTVSDALLDGARHRPAEALAMVNQYSHSGLAAKPSFPGPGAWLHGANLALMARVLDSGPAGVNLFAHDFGLCNAYARGLEAAVAVRCPATLIVGARDQMTPPRASQALAQALKATTHTLPCGHALMQECPDGVLAALRTALAA